MPRRKSWFYAVPPKRARPAWAAWWLPPPKRRLFAAKRALCSTLSPSGGARAIQTTAKPGLKQSAQCAQVKPAPEQSLNLLAAGGLLGQQAASALSPPLHLPIFSPAQHRRPPPQQPDSKPARRAEPPQSAPRQRRQSGSLASYNCACAAPYKNAARRARLAACLPPLRCRQSGGLPALKCPFAELFYPAKVSLPLALCRARKPVREGCGAAVAEGASRRCEVLKNEVDNVSAICAADSQ